MAEKKMTKKEVINAMLNEEAIKGNQVYADFLKHELELLEKKATNKKPTKTQEENEKLKGVVLNVLELHTGTISDLQKCSAELSVLTNQKITSLMGKLLDEGKVERITDKKKAIYKLKNAETEVEGD